LRFAPESRGPINTAPARPKKNGREEAIGRSRGGLTTKIHVIVDALGLQLAIRLTDGQVHDVTQAQALAAEVEPDALIGDKGCDADSLIKALGVRRIKPVIPPKANRSVKRDCDYGLYAERNFIERFFNTLKHFRAIANRYEKTARNYLAGVHLACALTWLN
jgi:transposase